MQCIKTSRVCSDFERRQMYRTFFSLALQPLWALASAFQFHDHFTDGRTPWTSDQLVARPLPKHRTTQTQNKHIHTHQTLMPCVEFEPTILAFQRAKTVHALDHSATVTGQMYGTTTFLFRKPERKRTLDDLEVDGTVPIWVFRT
jgi:hypothetical protein